MTAFDGKSYPLLVDIINRYRPKIIHVTPDAFLRIWERTRSEHHRESVAGELPRIELHGTTILAPDMIPPMPLAGLLDLRGDGLEFTEDIGG